MGRIFAYKIECEKYFYFFTSCGCPQMSLGLICFPFGSSARETARRVRQFRDLSFLKNMGSVLYLPIIWAAASAWLYVLTTSLLPSSQASQILQVMKCALLALHLILSFI